MKDGIIVRGYLSQQAMHGSLPAKGGEAIDDALCALSGASELPGTEHLRLSRLEIPTLCCGEVRFMIFMNPPPLQAAPRQKCFARTHEH